MKAVFTFWSKPANESVAKKSGGFFNEYYQVISMKLAVLQAKKQFDTVEFYTDDEGKKKFVDDGLIAFDEVHVILNDLPINPNLWAYAKVLIYSMQTEPFIHIDNDVFLLKPIPFILLESSVFVQSFEALNLPIYDFYLGGADFIASKFNNEAIRVYNALPVNQRYALNMGIFGGTAFDVIARYAQNVLAMLNSVDMSNWTIDEIEVTNVTMEQYFLSAFLYNENVTPTYYVNNVFNKTEVKNRGYVHAFSYGKSSETICKKIEATYLRLLFN